MRSVKNICRALYDRATLKADRGPVGIGLIGVGGWGFVNAANIMRSRRFTVAGVYDVHEDHSSGFCRRFKTEGYRRLDEMMAVPGVQAVCITVPNHFHPDMVRVAADAGKHVFVEKPLASDADICRTLGLYCAERGVILSVGHQMRREPVFRELKRIVEDGTLGQPLFAQGVCTLDRRSRDDWRRDPGACPGGSMEQLGVHLIDVLIALFGPAWEARGWVENGCGSAHVSDWAHISMSFAQEIHAAVSTSFSSPAHMSLEIFFDRGHVVTDGRLLRITRGISKRETFRTKGIPGGVAQFIEFADCIEHGRTPETGAAEAAMVMEVVQSISKSE